MEFMPEPPRAHTDAHPASSNPVRDPTNPVTDPASALRDPAYPPTGPFERPQQHYANGPGGFTPPSDPHTRPTHVESDWAEARPNRYYGVGTQSRSYEGPEPVYASGTAFAHATGHTRQGPHHTNPHANPHTGTGTLGTANGNAYSTQAGTPPPYGQARPFSAQPPSNAGSDFRSNSGKGSGSGSGNGWWRVPSLMFGGAVLALLAVGIGFFIGGKSPELNGQIPVITAGDTPERTEPDVPGGMEIPDRDKTVMNDMMTRQQIIQNAGDGQTRPGSLDIAFVSDPFTEFNAAETRARALENQNINTLAATPVSFDPNAANDPNAAGMPPHQEAVRGLAGSPEPRTPRALGEASPESPVEASGESIGDLLQGIENSEAWTEGKLLQRRLGINLRKALSGPVAADKQPLETAKPADSQTGLKTGPQIKPPVEPVEGSGQTGVFVARADSLQGSLQGNFQAKIEPEQGIASRRTARLLRQEIAPNREISVLKEPVPRLKNPAGSPVKEIPGPVDSSGDGADGTARLTLPAFGRNANLQPAKPVIEKKIAVAFQPSGKERTTPGPRITAKTGPTLTGPALTGPALTDPALTDPTLTDPVTAGSVLKGPAPQKPRPFVENSLAFVKNHKPAKSLTGPMSPMSPYALDSFFFDDTNLIQEARLSTRDVMTDAVEIRTPVAAVRRPARTGPAVQPLRQQLTVQSPAQAVTGKAPVAPAAIEAPAELSVKPSAKPLALGKMPATASLIPPDMNGGLTAEEQTLAVKNPSRIPNAAPIPPLTLPPTPGFKAVTKPALPAKPALTLAAARKQPAQKTTKGPPVTNASGLPLVQPLPVPLQLSGDGIAAGKESLKPFAAQVSVQIPVLTNPALLNPVVGRVAGATNFAPLDRSMLSDPLIHSLNQGHGIKVAQLSLDGQGTRPITDGNTELPPLVEEVDAEINQMNREILQQQGQEDRLQQQAGQLQQQQQQLELARRQAASNDPPAESPFGDANIPFRPDVPAGLTPDAVGTPYAIQIASVRKKARAGKEWEKVKRKFPELLGDMVLGIEKVRVKGKTFYRVQAGPVYNRMTAVDLCASLKARRQPCIVAKRK